METVAYICNGNGFTRLKEELSAFCDEIELNLKNTQCSERCFGRKNFRHVGY